MINTVLVLAIIYLLSVGGRNGYYMRKRGDGYGRQNKYFSNGQYSEYGRGNGQGGRFNEYNGFSDRYGGSQSNNMNGGSGWGSSNNSGGDMWGSSGNDSWGSSNSSNDDWGTGAGRECREV